MITVKQSLNLVSSFAGDAGMSPDSQDAMDSLNRARMLLYPLGDWDYTTEYGRVSVNCNGHFYLPSRFGSIRMVWHGCSQKGVEPRGEYYSQIVGTPICGECIGAPQRTGMRSVLPVLATACALGLSSNDSEDEGSEVTVAYTNQYGTFISDKKQLDKLAQVVYTEYEIGSVKSISKNRTHGDVSVWLGDKIVSTMSFMETSMMHEQYYMGGYKSCYFTVKAKKRFFDYTFDDVDLPLDIDNIDAIEFAMIAINSKKKNDLQSYERSLSLAKGHLNLSKEDKEESISPGLPSFNQGDLGLSYQ